MRSFVLVVLLFAPAIPTWAVDAADDPPLVTLDETVWVLFYDLPSRRFRNIRDAFIRRNFEMAQRDLATIEGFLRAETARADAVLQAPLIEVVGRLHHIAANIDSNDITVRDLDPVFARAHWLLAQHYLTLSTQARNSGRHTSAGHYLSATAHHVERTVLWSDARISNELLNALDGMRSMANELRTSDKPERVYRQKPIHNARRTILKLGEVLDRKVRIDSGVPPEK